MVVSVFVNPLQFGAGEDFGRYPRALEQDLAICAEEGAAVVFAPGPDQVYPAPPLVRVDPGPVGQLLEGRSRPGFFGGVLTVVLKLFQLVRPDVAVFGQKDAQQLALVRQMSADLDLGVTIAAVPIVRDPDGLAISSRNAYLSPADRSTALALSRALAAGTAAATAAPPPCWPPPARCWTAPPVRPAARARLPGTGGPGPLHRGRRRPPRPGAAPGRGPVRTTRLIDNTRVTLGGEP